MCLVLIRFVYKRHPRWAHNKVLADRSGSDPITLADIKGESGVVRYRRYRIGNVNTTSSAHVLLKRRWQDVDGNSDLVYMPSNAIVKHGLLGKLAEDNADIRK